MIPNRLMASGAVSVLLSMVLITIPESAGAGIAPEQTPPPTGMLGAMQRDLGLTREQAVARLANEQRASELRPVLRTRLKDRYAGSWVESDGTLVVASTDAGDGPAIAAAGARPRVFGRSLAALTALKGALDRAAKQVEHADVPVWFVDERTNSVVVQALDPAAADAFLAAGGVSRAGVRVETITERPVSLANMRGGDAYFINNNTRCSVGFPVTQGGTHGFVTAGHCGTPGARTTANGNPQGTFQGSSFPGNDYGWVAGNGGWLAQPAVNGYGAGQIPVFGSADAPEGAAVCRSGSTTQWRCGTILQRNTSVTYPQGTVNEVVRTNACAEPGDSGGPFISGNQAQGVTSGGSGNCAVGGIIFFQPVNEILGAFGLSLVTSAPQCAGYPNTYFTPITAYQGSFGRIIPLPGNHPSNGFTSNSSGTHNACLGGPGTASMRLSLQRYSCCTGLGLPIWTTVANTGIGTTLKTLSTSQSPGTFRWVVTLETNPLDFEDNYYLLGTSSPA